MSRGAWTRGQHARRQRARGHPFGSYGVQTPVLGLHPIDANFQLDEPLQSLSVVQDWVHHFSVDVLESRVQIRPHRQSAEVLQETYPLPGHAPEPEPEPELDCAALWKSHLVTRVFPGGQDVSGFTSEGVHCLSVAPGQLVPHTHCGSVRAPGVKLPSGLRTAASTMQHFTVEGIPCPGTQLVVPFRL